MSKSIKSALTTLSVIPAMMLLLLEMILPRFTRNKENSWTFEYSGDDSMRDGSIAFSGELIRNSVLVPGTIFEQTVEQGPPNAYLEADQNAWILIEFQKDDLLRRCKVRLGTLIDENFQGRILFRGDSDGVTVSVYRNKWGRSLSIDTGRTYRNSKLMGQVAYLWRASPSDVKPLFSRGLLHADDEFNAQFRGGY